MINPDGSIKQNTVSSSNLLKIVYAFVFSSIMAIVLIATIFCVYPESLLAGGKTLIFYGDDNKRLCDFRIEIAATPMEQEKGLMFRKSLKKNAGMLFIYDGDEIRFFWMKNTFIPLDIVFIDSRLKVTDIYRSAKPNDETTIPSRAPARFALEINAGMVDRCRISIGNKIGFKGF